MKEIIYEAAAAHGLSGPYLVSVAQCESGLNPNAVNAAGYHGLFQFDYTTWNAYGNGSIYDPAAQAQAAAALIAGGEAERWPNCA
ncbi:MAG: transglycosylase family protein [Actinobacteria bacterium]|nr:transglycosylase family protein [Actinomycetota bacterium]